MAPLSQSGSGSEPATTDRTATRELAAIEYDLERSSALDSDLVGDGTDESARIYFDTYEPNEATRGRLTAAVTTAIVNSDGWDLVTIHDPLEADDEPVVYSAITVRRDTEGGQ